MINNFENQFNEYLTEDWYSLTPLTKQRKLVAYIEEIEKPLERRIIELEEEIGFLNTVNNEENSIV